MECLVEKIVLRDDRVFLLYNPKYMHHMDGRVLVGRALQADGRPMDNTVVVPPDEIAWTVGMKEVDGELVEDRSIVAPSLR